jgi:predicted glycosyltransferase
MNGTSVVIDILHYPHVNFYKHAIEALREKNIGVQVILRPRGNLQTIFEKECPDVPFVLIGQHRKTIFGKMFDMVERDIAFLRYLSKIKFDAGTGFGSINIAHTTRFFRKPSILFGDDIECKSGHYLGHCLATRDVRPKCVPANGKNLLKYSGFKELAYLHPNHFTPDKKALELYNLNPYNYIFIREVSSASLNYRKLEMGNLSKTNGLEDCSIYRRQIIGKSFQGPLYHFKRTCKGYTFITTFCSIYTILWR